MSADVQNTAVLSLPNGITHLASQQRYVYVVGGEQVGIADYHLRGDVMHITHTEMSPGYRGSGLGSRMVQRVLDAVHGDTRLRVVANCPFVADFIDRNPQYRELTTRGL